MARVDRSLRRKKRFQQFQFAIIMVNLMFMLYIVWYMMSVTLIKSVDLEDRKKIKKRLRGENLNRLIRESDIACNSELRVNRHTFTVLCEMVRDIGGLRPTRNMCLEEIVAMFLYTLAHHRKNRSIGHHFIRSGESVSRQFNLCLRAVIKLHDHLLKKPTPITDDCEDERWACFKNCLGALDGTYVSATVPTDVRGKYRTRKGSIAMNVLGVCSPEMEFIYVLPGWEGSAHDGRVLRNAISRPDDGLRVPQERNGRIELCAGWFEEFDSFQFANCDNHRKAKGLYGVPFPYYDVLAEVYGKDKATGDFCEGFKEAVKNLDVEVEKEPMMLDSDEDVDATGSENSVTRSVTKSIKKESGQPPCKKLKRQSSSTKGKGIDSGNLVASFDSASSRFGDIFLGMSDHIATMAKTMSRAEDREQNLDDKTNSILDEVMKLDGISPSEALEASTVLIDKENMLRVFYQASPALRKQYVLDLLKKK